MTDSSTVTESSASPTGSTGSGPLMDDLQWRGLIQDSTGPDELRAQFAAGPVTFYVGFDPTAPSLHVGNLMQITTARRLQLAGHHPLLLVGARPGRSVTRGRAPSGH